MLDYGRALAGHQDSVWTVALSPDGNRLTRGVEDNELLLSDVVTQQKIGPLLLLYNARILSVKYSPDGHIIATGGIEGSLFLWDADLESWKSHTCRRANRNLTLEEWRHFFDDEPYQATCPALPTPGLMHAINV